MQVTFKRWCVDPKGRTPVSVDPTRVEATEHFSDKHLNEHGGLRWSDDQQWWPAATKIIMRNKKEYIVQGMHYEIVNQLNATKED